jgi:hydrogenase maturation protein HypF
MNRSIVANTNADAAGVAKILEISGVVQGVGFRPFLFVLAKKYHLTGEVSNTPGGVKVVVEGLPDDIKKFSRGIRHETPLLASVTHVETRDTHLRHFSSFQIVKSQASTARSTFISPDVSICEDCLAEMNDPGNRRYQYPFINCTNCGPRFTIIEDIPYDRPKTSMKQFAMCPACRQEYEDPLNRRFHAQPNACPDCGPHVFLTDNRGKIIDLDPQGAVARAAQLLGEGKIVGVKGLGGFHLACDASDSLAVIKLRRKKSRPHKPFALMAGSAAILFDHVHVGPEEKKLLESYSRPIVLLEKKGGARTGTDGIAQEVAPFNHCLGIMLPYTPLHYLLLEKGPDILVMTSGNRPHEPLSIENEDALEAFAHIADYFLLHNRDIYFRADDSITRIQAGEQRFVRRSRGYAPLPILLDTNMPGILSCGAGLKNTVCLTRENQVFLSQHIGDMDNVKAYDFYENSISHLKKILDIAPEMIAHDMHPGYMSTRYAMAQKGIKKIAVQHHHAHAAACMAENKLDEPVIALTLDGTGYGPDHRIWGGEVLVCTRKAFKRKAHLSYVHMPGGDAAVLEPWRMAASVLYQAFGKDFLNLDIPYTRQMDPEKLSFVCRMMEKNLNSPLTSSAGRLFDAIASLVCIRHTISHESQAAMELEALAHENSFDANRSGVDLSGENLPVKGYDFDLIPGKDKWFEISLMSCIRQIVTDIGQGRPPGKIALGFHHTMVQAFLAAALRVSRETGIKRVVLSGGVFNNTVIFNGLTGGLEENHLTVYTHTRVPTGDGGICLGQAVVAAAQAVN